MPRTLGIRSQDVAEHSDDGKTMRIDYQPIGRSGFHCELTNDVGFQVIVEASDGEVRSQVSPEGLPAQAAVAAVERYGGHEYDRRRTRDEEKRRHHAKEAREWLEVATDVGELLWDLTDETEYGWCSDCFTKADHRLAGSRSKLGRRRYVCTSCGSPTGHCDVPRCKNFADRGGAPSERSRYCAEHGHQIPSFEKLSTKVGSLDEYRSWLEFERINAKGLSTVAAISVAGVAVVGPMAFVAAPAIGGAIGAYAGLSGAAASSHGLALLGFGSVAAGGLGMAGGTAVVTAAGVGLGGAAGASVASAYVRSDKSFGFEKVAEGGPTTVIFANGFLSEGQTGWGDWRRLVTERYPDATIYRLKWGAKELKSLTDLLPAAGAKPTAKAIATVAAKATKTAPKALGPVGNALAVAGLAKNPWHVARTRASMTGVVLADAIVRADVRSVVLIGFSLGGRVMAAAAESLATRRSEEAPRIEAMHLLGAAVGTHRDWRAIEPAVEGTVYNYFSKNDRVLKALYRAAEGGTKAIGAEGIPTKSAKVKNVDVSKKVGSHSEHLRAVSLR